MITLVLGGARSGKSRFAEKKADEWLQSSPLGERVYVATAQIVDDEMRARVDQHKVQRGEHWQTVEEPKDLLGVLTREARLGRFILVDCLTLWLTNLLLAEDDCEHAITQLCSELPRLSGEIVFVSNEVGLGIVPENKLARQFRDIAGIANQRIAEMADEVVFISAGLPMLLKPSSYEEQRQDRNQRQHDEADGD